MTANFSFPRLLQLIHKQGIENYNKYMLSTLALIAALGIFALFWIFSSNNHTEETLYYFFLVGLFVSGAVFASSSFNKLQDKAKGAYYLSIPATHLEKLVCMIIFNVFIYTAIYCLCFLLVKTVAVTYIRHSLSYHFTLVDWEDNKLKITLPYFFYAFFCVQAFYLLGSVYFSRFSFMLTTVIGVVLYSLLFLSSEYLFKNYLPRHYHWVGSYVYHIDSLNAIRETYYPSEIFLFLLKFIWVPVFWLATWYRLKEKEI